MREDAASGTVVVRLEVGDADAAGAPLSFFVSDGDPRARFQLRPSGELYVARELDRETEPLYELRVAATDGKFTAQTRVRITVLDVNGECLAARFVFARRAQHSGRSFPSTDNPPYCLRHRYYARLPEDAANGTRVMTLETGDADEPSAARLRYYLTGDMAHHFSIHKVSGGWGLGAAGPTQSTRDARLLQESGEVVVAARLDREARASYRLRAHAQDRERADWECSSELVVALDDVNDNAPHFSANTYSVTLPEDADLGTLVAKVRVPVLLYLELTSLRRYSVSIKS